MNAPTRRVIVRRETVGLSAGYSVTVEPRVVTFPSRWPRDRAEALRIAGELSTANGWPVDDRTGDRGAK